MNLNINNYKEIILEVLNEYYPKKYNSKYSYIYYIEYIISVLRDITSWKSLGNLLKNTLNKKYHYKTIYNMFLKWSYLDIFKISYNKLLLRNNTYTSNSTVDLFIDSTSINNKYGSQDVNYGKNKKKKMSKISLIGDINKNVYSVSIFKDSVHDSKTIEHSIDKLLKFKHKRLNIIGDKGYVSNNIKKELHKKNINLIYPKKKNQKEKTTKYEKKKLSKRYIIEHINQRIKNFNRISLRKDKLNKTFISNIYLALILIFFQEHNNK